MSTSAHRHPSGASEETRGGRSLKISYGNRRPIITLFCVTTEDDGLIINVLIRLLTFIVVQNRSVFSRNCILYAEFQPILSVVPMFDPLS